MTRLTSEWSRARELSLGLIMRVEKMFNFACAAVFKLYRAANARFEACSKNTGMQSVLGSYFSIRQVNGRKKTGASPA